MPDLMDLQASLSRLHARYPLICQVALVLSCGGMIGSAMFFPFDAIGNHRYCDILIKYFVVSATVWHTLSLEALIVYGIYILPTGLVVVLLVAILAGPARADVAAWLPLSIVTLSFITVAAHSILHPRRLGNIILNSHSDNSSLQKHRKHQPMYRFQVEPGPIYIRPPSSPPATCTKKSIDTTLTLSSTPARARPSWGHQVLELFVNPATFQSGHQLSRGSSQDTIAYPCDLDEAALPDDGEDISTDAEHRMYNPLLGLDFTRAASPN
ncbi:hypothetical protein VMCG_01012 [Cytospora schulzeri]|uniref:Uncharacterized protein n=1 Tax=Cytospora schulzeri TaxID=448051 RepID=A0A423X4R6_9PEZI|nr:hypothetical protein VMCG_01012 [Valsa malicola]